MRSTLKKFVGRIVVVSVDGAPLRGTLQQAGRDAVVLAGVEQEDGTPLDGFLVIPYPVTMQVV